MKLPVIPQDKANHFAYGAMQACLGCLLYSPWLGLAFCLIPAIAKEAHDRITGKGHPEFADFLAQAAGGAMVLAPLAMPTALF